MASPCQIRPVAHADLDQLAEIERSVFSDPWPRSAFPPLLGEFSLVAAEGPRVIGYVISRVTADEAEILNLAVRPDFRRLGVAGELLRTVENRFEAAGAHTVYLEVRESNDAGRAFYEVHGFHPVGRRRGYYQRPREDALILRKMLPAVAENGPLRHPETDPK